MTWEDIDGWFDFEDIYDMAVAEAPNKCTFVEIGCYKGKSTVYMAEKIRRSGKNIRFITVDCFIGEQSRGSENVLEEFEKNLHECGVTNVELIVSESFYAGRLIEDDSVFFVFIDGDHSVSGCLADIMIYWEKVTFPGIIAGHDYMSSRGVRDAVNYIFANEEIKISKNSWYVRVR